VRNLPLAFDRRVPEGPPLHPGSPQVVEAWNARARREVKTARALTMAAVALALVSAAAGALPSAAALAVAAAGAVLLPLAVVAGGSRAGQKPFDVFERGVHATERRRLLRFRRFAPFDEIVSGRAREAAPGRFAVTLTLIDGTTLDSVPGEVSAEAVDYLAERLGRPFERASARLRAEAAAHEGS
jgi:hypothetical protein